MALPRHRRASMSTTSTSKSSRQKVPPPKKDGKTPMKKNEKHPKPNKQNHSTLYTGLGIVSPVSTDDTSEPGADGATGAESDEDDAEDDDLPRANAPSGHVKRSPDLGNNATWAGLGENGSSNGSEASDSDTNMGDGLSEFDVPDDDDDYNNVDTASEASDESAAFEAAVEMEIFAAGEDGIDWDDQNTYGYTGPDSQYFLEELALSNGYFGVSELDMDFVHTAPPADAAPLTVQTPVEMAFRIASPKLDIDWCGSASSVSNDTASNDAASIGGARSDSESPSRKTSYDTGLSDFSAFTLRFDQGQETDEDEPPIATVSSPAVTLSRSTTQDTSGGPRSRVIDATTPARVGLKPPVKGKLKLNPNKAIAYSVDGPRVMVFRTPKGSKMKWVDMRRLDSGTDSSNPGSPTMIDLDAAILEGNQRTGAAITDAIHGQMFRQYHCIELDFAMYAPPTSHAEFARVPFLNGGGLSNLITEEGIMPNASASLDVGGDDIQPEVDTLELIDFDGGARRDESPTDHLFPTSDDANTDLLMLDDVMNDTESAAAPLRTPKGKGKARDASETLWAQVSTTPSTPADQSPTLALSPTLAFSPLKRRVETRSASPPLKKKRH